MGLNVTTGLLIRGRQQGQRRAEDGGRESERRRFEDAVLLALMVERGVMNRNAAHLLELEKGRRWILP